jgi:hypothetical protein
MSRVVNPADLQFIQQQNRSRVPRAVGVDVSGRQEQERIGISRRGLQVEEAAEARQQERLRLDKENIRQRLSSQFSTYLDQQRRAQNLLNNPGAVSISGPFQGLMPQSAFALAALTGKKDAENAFDAFADWNALVGPAGLAELGELRAQSPTGGAVGQVSNYEQGLLQQAAGRFTNRLQTDESFTEALNDYVKQLNDSMYRLNFAYKAAFGDEFNIPGAENIRRPREFSAEAFFEQYPELRTSQSETPEAPEAPSPAQSNGRTVTRNGRQFRRVR